MPRHPHNRLASGRTNGIRQRLRTLHVEDDGLPFSGAREDITRVQNEDMIAPDNLTVAIDQANAIGIAIERNAKIGFVFTHSLDTINEVFRNRGVGMVVGKRAIAFGE